MCIPEEDHLLLERAHKTRSCPRRLVNHFVLRERHKAPPSCSCFELKYALGVCWVRCAFLLRGSPWPCLR